VSPAPQAPQLVQDAITQAFRCACLPEPGGDARTCWDLRYYGYSPVPRGLFSALDGGFYDSGIDDDGECECACHERDEDERDWWDDDD
jgi:hypothetical protein